MGKASNIVHQYFKKELEGATLLVRVNPIQLLVTEITIPAEGEPALRQVEVDAEIFEDLEADGFSAASPLEFNLYLAGLV